MKTLLVIIFVTLVITLNAQGYTFVRGTFNSTGGAQHNSAYNTQTAVGEYVQNDVTSPSYYGYLGFLFPQLDQSPPVITSISDVPNDQGRKVQIIWNKCVFDDAYDLNTYYSVWRYDENFNSRNSLSASGKKVKEVNIYTEPWQAIQQFKIAPDKIYCWDNGRDIWTFVDTVRALQYDQYSYIAETLADSSSAGTNYATFKVVFHDEFAYYESEAAEGYSTDDIAPDATRGSITQIGSNLKLTWEKVEYGTFEGNRYPEINGIYYKIYASDKPQFVCDSSTYITTTTNTSYVYNPTENKRFFKIVVSDKP